MKAREKRRNYLLDFYPSKGVYFHCELTPGTIAEKQKKNLSTQVHVSQCSTPEAERLAQCPTPSAQCPTPSAQCPTPSAQCPAPVP
jgi:hypothetical protein